MTTWRHSHQHQHGQRWTNGIQQEHPKRPFGLSVSLFIYIVYLIYQYSNYILQILKLFSSTITPLACKCDVGEIFLLFIRSAAASPPHHPYTHNDATTTKEWEDQHQDCEVIPGCMFLFFICIYISNYFTNRPSMTPTVSHHDNEHHHFVHLQIDYTCDYHTR